MKTSDRFELLNGLGMSISSLNRLWKKAESGDIDSIASLALIAAGRPKLGLLLDEFRRGVSGDKSVIATQQTKATSNPWQKLRRSNKNECNPSSAGLPSFGKRR